MQLLGNTLISSPANIGLTSAKSSWPSCLLPDHFCRYSSYPGLQSKSRSTLEEHVLPCLSHSEVLHLAAQKWHLFCPRADGDRLLEEPCWLSDLPCKWCGCELLFTAFVLRCPWEVTAFALDRGNQKHQSCLPTANTQQTGLREAVYPFSVRDIGEETAWMSQLGWTRGKTCVSQVQYSNDKTSFPHAPWRKASIMGLVLYTYTIKLLNSLYSFCSIIRSIQSWSEPVVIGGLCHWRQEPLAKP